MLYTTSKISIISLNLSSRDTSGLILDIFLLSYIMWLTCHYRYIAGVWSIGLWDGQHMWEVKLDYMRDLDRLLVHLTDEKSFQKPKTQFSLVNEHLWYNSLANPSLLPVSEMSKARDFKVTWYNQLEKGRFFLLCCAIKIKNCKFIRGTIW